MADTGFKGAMDDPLTLWSNMLLRLGLVLLALGVLPLLAVQYLFTGFDPLVPVLLSLSVAPLGAAILVIGAILFLAAVVQRRRRERS